MFGKKLLSIVSALFLGSQFITTVYGTAAEDLTDCDDIESFALTGDSECTPTDSPTGFYCKKDCVIFGLIDNTKTSKCEEKIDSGIVVFNGSGAVVDLDGEAAVTTDNLLIYDCSGSACERTYGYVLYNSKYYTVGHEGNAMAESVGNQNCGTANIGTLFSSGGVKLCVAESSGTQNIDASTEAKYIMINKANNIFTGGASNTNQYIVVKATEKLITQVQKDGFDYCVGSNESVTETYKELCNQEGASEDAPCGTSLKLSECTNGLCTRQSNDPCKMKPDGSTEGYCHSAGYYIVNIPGEPVAETSYNLVTDTTTEGTLYYCSTPDSKKCTAVESDGFKGGYYPNAGNNGGNKPYIKCTANNNCKAVGVDSKCTAAGLLISNGAGGHKLCLAAGVSADVSHNGDYFFDVSAEDNLFATYNVGSFVRITFASGIIKIADQGSANKYKYATDEYKYTAVGAKDAVCQGAVSIVEFKFDKTTSGVHYYTKHAEATWTGEESWQSHA